MKHLMMADKSLLIGDDVAEKLVEYATLIAGTGRADNVTLHAIGADGASVDATILLDSGTNLISETVDSELPEPANDSALQYLTSRISLIADPPDRSASTEWGTFDEY